MRALGKMELTTRPGIKYEDLAYTTQNGFAAVGSNNGHNGTGGLAFYRNPDVVEDFAWRSCVLPLLLPVWMSHPACLPYPGFLGRSEDFEETTR